MLLIDINILVDIITERSGYYPSLVLIDLVRKKKFKGFISPLTVATTWYLISKDKGEVEAKKHIIKLIKGLEIIDLTKDIVENALNLEQKDIEDSIQALSAFKAKCTHIITRDKSGFSAHESKIKVRTPQEFLDEEGISWSKKKE